MTDKKFEGEMQKDGASETGYSSAGRVEYVLSWPPVPERDDIKLSVVLARLYKRKFTIFLSLFACLVLALVVFFVSAKQYESAIVFAPVATDTAPGISELLGQFGGLASLAGIDVQGQADERRQWLALLESRSFTERFISQEGLLPVLFSKDWDFDEGQWKSMDETEVPTLGDAFRKFDNDVRTVKEDVANGLVTLTVRWTDRHLAAEWANKLVDEVNDHIRERVIEEAEKTIAYLTDQLSKTSVVEIKQGIYGLIEGQMQRIMIANVRSDYAFQVIDRGFVADPEDNIWPRLSIILALGGIVGLFLGVLISLVLESKAIFRTIPH